MKEFIVALVDGSKGTRDAETTICTFSAKSLPFIPRVGELVVVDEGFFVIIEVAHILKEKRINLWIDPKQSDYY